MNKAEKETYREKYNRIRKELIEELRPLAEIKSQLLTDIEIANRKDLANPTQLPIPALQSLRKVRAHSEVYALANFFARAGIVNPSRSSISCRRVGSRSRI
jgi:hypothetical protein